MEYSLQQYAAMTQAQLFNGNQHSEQQQQQQQQQQQLQLQQQQQQQQHQGHLQDPNAGYSLTYSSFPLIRMAPPQLHQPTLAKEMSSSHTHTNTTSTISPNTISSPHISNNTISQEDLNSQKERMLSPVTPIRVTRPPNAYLLFNKEMRKILKDQDPTMKVADISKEVGSRWKNMPKEQKDQYVNQANKLKEEQRALHPNSMYIRRSRAELVKAGHFTKRSHQVQQANSPSSSSSTSSSVSGSVNRSTDPTQPKRKKNRRDKNSTIPKHPLSAYMWYLTEVRPETMRNFPGSNVGQISKLCADRWNTMSEEARSPWNLKAQMDKDRYAREMQIYALQNDQNLGRGTRQKYRSAALRDTLTSHANTSSTFDTNSVVPLFYTSSDGKQSIYQLSSTESTNSILHNSLPMTLNPNALLQNHHNNTNTNSNNPFGNH